MTGLPEVLRVGDSSPDTAETSFRELDDAFLQTQARIWLGEVLHVRFDEDVAIADLIADGEMLFQVSKKVWKMLLKKHGELNHSKVYIYERTSSGRSDGRYMPYPKVDSFLKICQILGLTGIDLFSPSNVVEKRDTRRVCMCIRSLSKKARSKQLNVPDFDVVAYTIVMPTNFVGSIRKFLELSKFCSSKSIGSSPWNNTSETCGHKASCGHHYQLYDDSDETDSIFSDETGNGCLPPKSETSVDESNFNGDFDSLEAETSSPSSSIASSVEVNMECVSDGGKGRERRKAGSQVMRSVAGVLMVAGALALFFHLRQSSVKEERNERAAKQLQSHSRKPNQGVFSHSLSLYPGEKLNF